MTEDSVKTVTYSENIKWNLLLALPSASLSTSKARALLPDRYSREDAVANIQATALLVSAFAFSGVTCSLQQCRIVFTSPTGWRPAPLLPRLLPLAGTQGVLGVALSGAGPSVLPDRRSSLSHCACGRSRMPPRILRLRSSRRASPAVLSSRMGNFCPNHTVTRKRLPKIPLRASRTCVL